MTYVSGFTAAVPSENRDKFIAHAEAAGAYFKAQGALRVVECWGVDVPGGEATSFPMAVKAEAGETVVFSWIEWPSKAVADAAIHKMMNDSDLDPAMFQMPFDGKRMILGGFETIVEL